MAFEGLRLTSELGRWRRAGQTAVLWWRDDDARAPTPALRRLLDLSDAHDIPLSLAVVPDGDPGSLAGGLQSRPQVSVIQHGVDHQNRRQGSAAGEFSEDWTAERIGERLGAGWVKLALLPQAIPVFTPPWNDIQPALPDALRRGGYLGLSAWGELSATGVPRRVDAHIDVMRWKKGPRFRGAGQVWAALRRELVRRRRFGRWDAPIGLLTHHLAHDAAAWAFLERFLDWSAEQPELRWASAFELFAAGQMAAHPRREGQTSR